MHLLQLSSLSSFPSEAEPSGNRAGTIASIAARCWRGQLRANGLRKCTFAENLQITCRHIFTSCCRSIFFLAWPNRCNPAHASSSFKTLRPERQESWSFPEALPRSSRNTRQDDEASAAGPSAWILVKLSICCSFMKRLSHTRNVSWRFLILDPQDFTIQEIFAFHGEEDWPALDGRQRYHFPAKSLSAPVPQLCLALWLERLSESGLT